MYKPSVIIQARINSTRFKSKILKKINNFSILEILIKRLKKSKKIDRIIVACTKNDDDKSIIDLCKRLDLNYFVGSENNVLQRYYLAAKKFKIKNIIRITSDCPLIDVNILDQLIDNYLKKDYDYASNIIDPSFPDGMDVELFKFDVLKNEYFNFSNQINKEHVTTGILDKKNYKKFSLRLKKDYSKLKLSIDTPYDFKILKKLLRYFNNNIYVDLNEILKLFIKKPKFFEKNKSQERNIGMKLNTGQKTWIKAKNIIPGGTMLFSKNPDLLLPKKWPAYYSKAKGCYIWDLDSQKHLDFYSMGIGTNLLGYCRNEIDNNVIKSIKKSNMSSLNAPDDINLAEKLIEINPWAEMVRFTRSGGEANAVAIRIARASSGRENIAVCGYHGWHDWYLSSNLADSNNLNTHLMENLPIKGVPKGLKNTTFTFDYNNFDQLKKIVNEKNIGIIKMEVQRHEKPKNNFLKKVRKLANEKKIILIFDECTSGFRETYGGLHKTYDVAPDICIFGKALGNGYAINAIVGKREIMEVSNQTFLSSTFWTERIGSVAALETIKIMKKIKSWEIVTKLGQKLKKNWKSLAKRHSLNIETSGLDAIPIFNFKTKVNDTHQYKNYITQEMLKKKILASNIVYLSTSHNNTILERYFDNLDKIFKQIKNCENEEEDFNNIFKNQLSIKGIRQQK